MLDKDLQQEIVKAKQYLINTSSDSGENLYDNITGLIKNVLTERPKDAADLIEDYLSPKSGDKTKDVNEFEQVNLAEHQIKLFEKSNEDEFVEGGENEEEFEIPLPNCTQLAFYFEQAGIGLGREEVYRIFLALKQLVFNYPLSSVRFWGKIFGIEANYIIAEVEYREGEGEEEESNAEAEEEASTEAALEENEDEDGPIEEDELPKSTWKPPPVIPKEDHHSGTNKKVYYVCNQPGETWTKLPHVTPQEITAARQVTKLLTGRLEAPITAYPPFVGTEANFLRAQIARISSSTQISPAGFYMFDEDEEEEDEEGHESYMENVDFEGLSLRELTDASMTSWVHHSQHILPQGRCTWFNPFEKPEDDFEEEEYDDDEDEPENIIQPETGPQLLSSVHHDKDLGNIPAWSTYVSSRVLPEYAVAVARSNRWPGAYAFAKGRTFENIYIGWGKKYSQSSYTPPAPPNPLEEFPLGPETMEMEDPSVEEERALKERQDEAMKAADDMDNLDDDEYDD